MARPSEGDELRFHANFNFFENSVSSFPYKEVKRAIDAHIRAWVLLIL
jgi:hypothetical protein